MSRPEAGQGGVAALVRDTAATFPDRVALVETDGTTTSYAELVARASRVAHFLVASGLEPGDRVAAWLEDGSPYVEFYLACAMAGLVVVPLNSRHTSHEVRAVLDDSEPRALAWAAARDGAVEELADLLPEVRLRVPTHEGHTQTPHDARAWPEIVSTGSQQPLAVARPEDLLVIGYTSGTTGTPKGALLTHDSVGAVMRQHRAAYRLQPHSTIAMTGSMSFVSVVPAHVLTHLAMAGTIVFLGHWDVASLLDAIERHRATFTYLPSPVLDDFTQQAARSPHKWTGLSSVLHSASKAPAETLAALADVIGDRLVEGWGMTENSGGLMTATRPGDVLDPRLVGTVGRAIDGYDVRTVDDELWVRGPGLAEGYWRRPEASAEAFRDGWFRTGDLGSVDEQGYVTLVERRTDLIVTGGMNVYPAEVETVIAGLPGVAEVAVVGAQHPRWGQTVVAVVVPREDAPKDLVERVLERCRERLAGYKKPTEVILASALPRTVSLKVSRARVRDVVRERLGGPAV